MLSDRDFEYRYSRIDFAIAAVLFFVGAILVGYSMSHVGGLALVGYSLWTVISRTVPVLLFLGAPGFALAYRCATEIRAGFSLGRSGSAQVTAVAITVVDGRGVRHSMRADEINVLVSRRPLLTRLGRQPGWRFRLHGPGRQIPIYRYVENPDELEDAITTLAGLAAVEVRWWGRMYARPIQG